jgi:hypothetical protein
MRKPTVEKILQSDWPMSFAMNPSEEDGAFDGGCFCAKIHGEGFEVETHCWRSSCEHGCNFSGIHVSGEICKEDKRKIANHIKENNGWTNSTDFNIVIL